MTVVEHNKTFRLDVEAYKLLEQESKDTNASANAVINRLILNNLKRDRALGAVKRIHVTALTMKLLTEELSDDRVVEIGKSMADDVLLRDIPFEVSGTMSTESILETMKLLGEVHESNLDGRKVLILAYYSGRKWSMLMGNFWKALLTSVGTSASFSVDDDAVVFEFDSKLAKLPPVHSEA